MEEGSFRCDANISIRPQDSTDFLAKVEVKNMNSFKAVYLALEYEAKRQRRMAEESKKLIQETRGWVEERGITVAQRSKEYAHDYRYFPEPDLPPLVLNRDWVEEIRSKLPELPEARRDRFVAEYNLPLYDANLLTASKAMADYFEETYQESQKVSTKIPAKVISNWLLGPASGIINANNVDVTEFGRRVSPEQFAELLVLHSEAAISTASAKSVLEEMFNTSKDAASIITQRGLSQISDTEVIEREVMVAIRNNAQAVADYKAGKKQSLKFLVGQVMRATIGRANPTLVNQILEKKLEEV
jgi:aspartyl-tRNA(Asn)/glutamyl-tRNA(Gln) amidotransferase subunit B